MTCRPRRRPKNINKIGFLSNAKLATERKRMPREKALPRRNPEAAPVTVRVRTPQRVERIAVGPAASWRGFKELVFAQTGSDEQSWMLCSDASGALEIQADDLTSIADLDITNGSMIYLLPQPTLSKKRPRKQKGAETTAAEQKDEATAENEERKEGSRGRGPKQSRAEASEPVVGSFAGLPGADASTLARDYLSPDATEATGNIGESLFQQRLAAARTEAINGGNVHVAATHNNQRLAVRFRDKTSGKEYQEKCPLYSMEQIREVFYQVVMKRTTRRRRATAAMNESIFTISEIANRSPPILWSIYHASKGDANHGIRMILDDVQERVRAEAEQGGGV